VKYLKSYEGEANAQNAKVANEVSAMDNNNGDTNGDNDNDGVAPALKMLETEEQEKLLDKIQTLLSTAKTEYLSPLARLLSMKWDPFDSLESYDGFKSESQESLRHNTCSICKCAPDSETGYPPELSCLGCSPLVYDMDFFLRGTSLWSLIQPSDIINRDQVSPTGYKLRFAHIGSQRVDKGILGTNATAHTPSLVSSGN